MRLSLIWHDFVSKETGCKDIQQGSIDTETYVDLTRVIYNGARGVTQPIGQRQGCATASYRVRTVVNNDSVIDLF